MKKKGTLSKILCTILATMLSLSVVCTSVAAATTDHDINADGVFDISDSTHLQMYLAGYFDLSDSVLSMADADSSGSVDIGDVTRIQMMLAGYSFEEESTTATTQPTTSSQQDFSEYIDEVIRLTNVERTNAGLSALSKRNDICEIAQIRSVEISEVFSHTRPNGENCFSLILERDIPFKALGENVAYGQKTPQQAVEAWMNSPSHKENILDSDFTGIGVGCYQKGSTFYWVQYFIG